MGGRINRASGKIPVGGVEEINIHIVGVGCNFDDCHDLASRADYACLLDDGRS